MSKARPGMSRCVKAGCVLSSPVVFGQVLVSNHSRDRHGSIFDGAEWDEPTRVLVRLVESWRVELRPVLSSHETPLSWSARMRLRGRGEGWITARKGPSRCGDVCCVLLSCVEASSVLFCWYLETTYTVGVVAASMLRGGMNHG